MGIRQVYELLEAVYHDTKDERYKICPLLKKEYLLRSTIEDCHQGPTPTFHKVIILP